MSTNSRIAIANNDGTVKSVYCHWDGYPSNNGKILLEHYQDEEKIKELIALGGISSLGKNVKPEHPETHNFDNRENDCTTVYHRDRGDELVISEYKDVSTWSQNKNREEWNYIWKDGAWYFNGSQGKPIGVLTKLTAKHFEIG